MTTIQYILEHPDEFDKNAQVIIVPYAKTDVDKISVTEKKKRQRRHQQFFELFPPLRQTFSIEFYKRFKEEVGLNREDVNIRYNCTSIWFYTSSQIKLDRINKLYGTKFDYEKTQQWYLTSLDGIPKQKN